MVAVDLKKIKTLALNEKKEKALKAKAKAIKEKEKEKALKEKEKAKALKEKEKAKAKAIKEKAKAKAIKEKEKAKSLKEKAKKALKYKENPNNSKPHKATVANYYKNKYGGDIDDDLNTYKNLKTEQNSLKKKPNSPNDTGEDILKHNISRNAITAQIEELLKKYKLVRTVKDGCPPDREEQCTESVNQDGLSYIKKGRSESDNEYYTTIKDCYDALDEEDKKCSFEESLYDATENIKFENRTGYIKPPSVIGLDKDAFNAAEAALKEKAALDKEATKKHNENYDNSEKLKFLQNFKVPVPQRNFRSVP